MTAAEQIDYLYRQFWFQESEFVEDTSRRLRPCPFDFTQNDLSENEPVHLKLNLGSL